MKQIIIKRSFQGIGWISGLNFLNLETESPIKLRSYNGCLCFIINGKRIGYKTWKKKSKEVNIIINNDCPF